MDDDLKEAIEGLGESFVEFKSSQQAKLDEIADRVDGIEIRGNRMLRGNSSLDSSTLGAHAMKNIEDNSAFRSLKEWNAGTCRIAVKTSIKAAVVNQGSAAEGSNTFIPSQPEDRGLVGPVQRKVRLLEVLPTRPTTADAVEFIQINVTGDAAEQEREGDEKAAIELGGALRRAEIVTVAAHTTASKQVLEDHGGLQAEIDRVLNHKLLSKLEERIVTGTGGQGKINGLWNQAVLLEPSIGTTPADRIGESLVRMANEGYLPNLVLMNPLDWFKIQITRKNATDDEYVFGSPTMPVPPALWNTTVLPSPTIAEGGALTIDTSFTTVLDREAISVLLSNTHKDYFTRNLVAILGELRAGLEVRDVKAVRKIEL